MEWPGRSGKIVDLLAYGGFGDFCFWVQAISAGQKFHECLYKGIHLVLPFLCIVASVDSVNCRDLVGQKRSAALTYTGHSQGRLSRIGTKVTIHGGRGPYPLSSSLIAQMTQTIASLCIFNILSGVVGHE